MYIEIRCLPHPNFGSLVGLLIVITTLTILARWAGDETPALKIALWVSAIAVATLVFVSVSCILGY